MTPTEKQKCIAEQAVYGDLQVAILVESSQGSVYCEFESNFLDEYGSARDNYKSRKPILRPRDLTKSITHAGYNNDEPFIPLVELAKIIKPNFKSYELNVINQEVLCLMEGHSRRYELYLFDSKEILLEEADLLNRLHFDVRGLIPSNEAISTDEVNPYEVK